MRSIKTLLVIEAKNRSLLWHSLMIVSVFVVLTAFLSLTQQSYRSKLLSFAMFSFVIFGLIWSISMVEDLKNYQDSNLVKTFVSLPVSAVKFMASKLILFLISDLVSLFVGSFIAFVFIGKLNIISLEIFLTTLLFTLLSSCALYLLVSMISRVGMISEVVIVFFYFIVLSLNLIFVVSPSMLFGFFPFLYPFANTLMIPQAHIALSNILISPIIYILMIVLSLGIFKVGKWSIIYDYLN